MPLINKYKIINFKYGKGEDRLLSNRTMELYGDNLQVEAENTAGKTMSIQTIIQSICPLANVAKPFTAIYNKREPLYSLIEWQLDDDKTLLITGIGFERKAGTGSEEEKERKDDLYKYFMFIIEETPEIGVNIDNIPLLIKNDSGNKVVQSLSATEEYIKKLRDKHGKSKIHFFSNSAKKEHREKLLEYGINQAEWKEVIIKLNSDNKEGGLSEFVKEYNTGEKLIRDKILPLIETSLSSEEGNPILAIKEHVRKCLNNIMDIKDKLLDYENYKYLNESIEELEEKLKEILTTKEDENTIRGELASLYMYIQNKKTELEEEIEDYKRQATLKEEEQEQIAYEEESYEYHIKIQKIQKLESVLNKIKSKINEEIKHENINAQYLNIIKYKNKKSQIEKEEKFKIKKEAEKNKKEKSRKEIAKAINNIGSTIHFYLIEEIDKLNKKLEENNENSIKFELDKKEEKKEKERLEDILIEIKSKNKSLEQIGNEYERELNIFRLKNTDIDNFTSTNFLGSIIDFEKYLKSIEVQKDEIKNTIFSEEKGMQESKTEIEELSNMINSLKMEAQQESNIFENLKLRKEVIDNFIKEYELIDEKFEINEKLEDSSILSISLKKALNILDLNKRNLEDNKRDLAKQLDDLQNYKDIAFEEEILSELERNGIKPIEGIKYILNLDGGIDYKNNLICKNPLLPYSIIITNKDYNKLKNIQLKNKMKMSIPILVRDAIEDTFVSISNNLTISNTISILTSFDNSTLDPEKRKRDIEDINSYIENIKDKIEECKRDHNILDDFITKSNFINYSSDDLNIDGNILNCKNKLISLEGDIKSKISKKERLNNKINELIANKETLLIKKNLSSNKLDEVEKLRDKEKVISENKAEIVNNKNKIKEIGIQKRNREDKIEKIESNISDLRIQKMGLEKELESAKNKIDNFQIYEPKNVVNLSLGELEIKYEEYSKSPTEREIMDLNGEIASSIERINDYGKELEEFRRNISIPRFEEIVIYYSQQELNDKLFENKKVLDDLNDERENTNGKISEITGEINTKKEDIFKKFDGKEPYDIFLVKDYNFKRRMKDVKADLKDIKIIIAENNDKCIKLDQQLRELKKYKIEDKAITYYPADIFIESKKLQNKLESLTNQLYSLKNDYNNRLTKIVVFNAQKQEKYKNIIECLNVNKDVYERQIDQVRVVLLVIREEISKVETHSEQVKHEKNLIARQIKDYIIDCIEEFKIINKLGRHKGQILFHINVPKQDKVENSLNLVDILIDEIVEDVNLSDVEQKVNTFYILNRVINISRTPISVLKYEINRTENIKWDSINNETTGGQRFCISFIMTVLLLEYKRYDRNAIIDTSKYKGKVLLMDNPFGETSQQDFLQEIFELAKKFRVQIISYTHVTNASVRAMFNKIYLMTVEKTASKKEFVDINEIKQRKNHESVSMNKFNISNLGDVEQEDLFDLIH